MRPLFALFLAVCMATPGAAQDSSANAVTPVETEDAVKAVPEAPTLQPLEASDVSLDEYLWLKRPIVVFADTAADPRFRQQLELLLSRPEELLARDVVIIVDTTPDPRSEIRTKLRPRGFMLTLIEKDGRVNLRKPFPWDVREISHAIDKWPLRQQEIREAKEALR